MSVYVFQCCGRTVQVDPSSAPAVQMAHLCVGDVPCIGTAVATNATILQEVQAAAVQTEAEVQGTTIVVGTDGGSAANGDGN